VIKKREDFWKTKKTTKNKFALFYGWKNAIEKYKKN